MYVCAEINGLLNKRMKKSVFILFILLVNISCRSDKIKVFIAGDSTAQGYDTTKTVMRGWGQILPSFFTDEVEVVNHAKAGRSTKSFRAENRWDSIMVHVRKGDWVIIQFGHNDASSKPERYSSPEDFRKNIIRFVAETRERGANPLLLTSLVMRTFQDGALIDNRLKVYPGIIRRVAKEYNVPMIDINLKTRDLILVLGEERAKELYVPDDDTHTNEAGAKEVAQMIAEGIKELKLDPISDYVKIDK